MCGFTTSIGWTDSSRNAWMGCSKVYEICPVTGKVHAENGACNVCYVERNAQAMNFVFAEVKKLNWQNFERDLTSWPPRKIFLNDFTDWMHPAISDEDRLEFMRILARVDTHHLAKYGKVHQYQMLTKRAKKMEQFLASVPVNENYWMGVSIGNKASLYYLNHLKRVQAPIRFISFEPLVEDLEDENSDYRKERFIDIKYAQMFKDVFDEEGLINLHGIAWAIIGGESGRDQVVNGVHYPRPMNPAWAQRIIKTCRKYGTKVYFKQLGGIGNDGAGGCILEGQEIKEYPLIAI